MDIVPVTVEHLDLLSDLALRSKAWWGYDDAFLEACRSELTLSEDRLEAETVMMAVDAGRVLGFASVRIVDGDADLMDLFVEPDHIGAGAGVALFDAALQAARSGGARRMTIEADPHAEAWYLARGARRIGDVASGSIPGRRLPLLVVDV